ncbi:hypothetical protein ADL28_02705 [Streptomyces violaceusniger]|uniref:Uncharacterized protein n=2 Tax=Streptomyces violaceusniger group TaxID=2839105 RepID=A0ABD5J2V9_9ACTN|nr:hypothetical protein [Streptomyces violaceusniger]KUL67020.1 hypothetical protein ADL28_02705 [Streptomyces violaceusniger]MEE4582571.1 hypothetical protein [Streptomyces sp. DSM 41602]
MTEDERTERERIAELRAPGRKWVFGQLQGWNCALCAARLYADRPICTVEVDYGSVTETYQLYVCAPSCETARAAWETARAAWVTARAACETARAAQRPAPPDGDRPVVRAPRRRTGA